MDFSYSILGQTILHSFRHNGDEIWSDVPPHHVKTMSDVSNLKREFKYKFYQSLM